MSNTSIANPTGSPSPPAYDLRWFAGLAMQAIIQKQDSLPDTKAEREEIALWSYRMAQEMTATETRLQLDDESR